MSAARAHAIISGRVQGVFYRMTCQQEALRLGLSGWVRNLSDGRVELEAQGDREAVETLLAWCQKGPPGADVSGVEVDWSAATGAQGKFRVTG